MKQWCMAWVALAVSSLLAAGSAYGTWASGGVITTNGAYRIHTFTNSGTLTVGIAGDVEVLVVGGGGGAGTGLSQPNASPGGGGGGGVIYTSSFSVATGPITVIVGAGGYPVHLENGQQGGNSVFSTLTAIGGGGGGKGHTGVGGAGGSGGGAGNGGWAGGMGVPGQGHDGGPSYDYGRGGGGGGAGTVGGTGAGVGTATGGAGITNSISGTPTGYGGGGGGSMDGTAIDGGGAGGEYSSVPGTPNTGGGGGAGHYNLCSSAGGSGIVIVRYIASAPPTYYVWKDNPAPASPFTNWTMAATSIQDAVALAIDGDTVYVTNGIYNTGGSIAPGYSLTNRVCVTRAVTLRSFNNDPTQTIIEGAADPTGDADGYGPNAVRGVFLTNGASLVGFAVTKGHTFLAGGHASGRDVSGGGVVLHPNCVVSNCIVATNMSNGTAGGALLIGGGTVDDCLIVGNTNKGGGYGGGVTIQDYGTLNNCTVRGNLSEHYAAGVNVMNDGVLNNCQILNNNATVGQGGVLLYGGGSMKNCLVAGNAISVYNGAGNYGGGIDIVGDSSRAVTVDNCTVVNNSIPKGGGGIALRRGGGNTTVNNCIVWGNTTIHDASSNMYVSAAGVLNNCCSGPLWTGNGGGNIGEDPQFANASAGDYRLRATSPCYNKGTNLDWMATTYPYDLDRHARITSGTVDMGAYELIVKGTLLSIR